MVCKFIDNDMYNSLSKIELIKYYYDKKDIMATIEAMYLNDNEDLNKEEKILFNNIKNSLYNIFDISKIKIYYEYIQFLHLRTENRYELALYISKILWGIIEENNIIIDEKLRFRICDLIGRGYNHIGDYTNARIYFRKCKNLSHSVGQAEYLECNNRSLVSETNEFNFDFVKEVLLKSLERIEVWENLDNKTVEDLKLQGERNRIINLKGKILSNLAQNYAYAGDLYNAKKFFLQALALLKDSEYKLTLSFFLHLAVEHGDRKLYEEYINQYLKGNNLEEQYDYIIESNDKYLLFLYIKAINNIYFQELNEDLYRKIVSTEFKKVGFNVFGNPWQLIYKHLGVISYKKGDVELGNRFISEIETTSYKNEVDRQQQHTIRLINAGTLIEAYSYNKNSEFIDKALSEIRDISDSSEVIKEIFKDLLSLNNDDLIKASSSKFNFMFN